MGIRQKVLLIPFVIGLSAAVVLALPVVWLISNRFAGLEQAQVQRTIRGIHYNLEASETSLTAVSVDWSRWDDAYNYLQGADSTFAETNLYPEALVNLNIQLIGYLDSAGRPVALVALDQPKTGFDEATARAFEDFLQVDDNRLKLLDGSGAAFVMLPDRPPLLIAYNPVVKSDGGGATVGAGIFGRFLDDAELTRMSDALAFPVKMGPTAAPDLPADFRDALAQMTAGGSIEAIRPLTAKLVSGYAVFSDISGHPAFVIRVDLPRDIREQGIQTLLSLLSVGILVALLAAASGWFLIGRNFVVRLEKLAGGVKHAGVGPQTPTLEVGGNDELTFLADEINNLIRRQIEARRALDEALAETARGKALADELADDLQKFKQAVDGATDLVIITDSDLRVLYANAASRAVHGYEPSEMIGRPLSVSFAALQEPAHLSAWWLTLGGAKKPYIGQISSLKKDGAPFLAEIRSWPILDDHGRLRYGVSIVRDVTREREVENLRRGFVAIAPHQLKAPLTAIKWFSEALLGGTAAAGKKLTAEQKEFFSQIYETNERMIRLVNDLLSVSQLEAGQPFELNRRADDLMAVIRQVLAEQAVMAVKKDVRIELSPDAPQSLVISQDRLKIGQVIQNLINNAVKYSSAGGLVTVGVRADDKEVAVSVADRGIGIPAADQPHIFGKFFRADNARQLAEEGIGLGLFISKAIVETHGGRLWFESKEKQGTTFYFILPRA